MKILAIGAHPDDIEFYAGGTLARRAAEGDEVVFVVATDGRNGSYDGTAPEKLAEIRKSEQTEAARKIGVVRVIHLNFRDGDLENQLKKLKHHLLEVLLKERPEVVFTFDPHKQYVVHEDFHPDHRALALAVMDVILIDSTLPVKVKDPLKKPKIFLYNSYRANLKVDISGYRKKKEAAMKTFRSQEGRLGGYSTCVEKFRVYTSR